LVTLNPVHVAIRIFFLIKAIIKFFFSIVFNNGVAKIIKKIEQNKRNTHREKQIKLGKKEKKTFFRELKMFFFVFLLSFGVFFFVTFSCAFEVNPMYISDSSL